MSLSGNGRRVPSMSLGEPGAYCAANGCARAGIDNRAGCTGGPWPGALDLLGPQQL